jgi:adenylate kinase
MPLKIVIVAGLSGAGKTTLLKRLSSSTIRYKVIALGMLMKEEAARRGIGAGQDTLKLLDNKKVSRMNGNVVVDTHLSVEGDVGFAPGLPSSSMRSLKGLAGIVYVDADSSEIIKRRQKDMRTRDREHQSIASLDMQRAIDLSILAHYATELDIKCYVVRNREGFAGIAAKELGKALSDAFSG